MCALFFLINKGKWKLMAVFVSLKNFEEVLALIKCKKKEKKERNVKKLKNKTSSSPSSGRSVQ